MTVRWAAAFVVEPARSAETCFGEVDPHSDPGPRHPAVGAGVDVQAALRYIESQKSYFEALGGDPIGAKAAMIGYIISIGNAYSVGNYYQDLVEYVDDTIISSLTKSASMPTGDWNFV